MELGKVIAKFIKQKGMTQAEVAERIGKSPTALSQIVKGVYNPNPETLDKICEVLEIPKPLLYFMTISEEDVPKEKVELYRMLAPTLKDFVFKVFGDDLESLNSKNSSKV